MMWCSSSDTVSVLHGVHGVPHARSGGERVLARRCWVVVGGATGCHADCVCLWFERYCTSGEHWLVCGVNDIKGMYT